MAESKQKFPWIKIYYDIFKLFVARKILRINTITRNRSLSGQEYSEAWSRTADEIFDSKPRPEFLRGKLVYLTASDHRKFFLDYLQNTVMKIKPKSILEIGSGTGINLLALAVLNPGAEQLVGLELTKTGVKTSQKLLADLPIKHLIKLTGESEEIIQKRIKGKKIEFVQGDAAAMPFPDKSFDFAFSLWALEQIPREYPKVFTETKRVVKGHALFMEEFWEAQHNIFQKMHLLNMDYFRASYGEAEKAGLKIMKFETIPLNKIKHSNGALFCAAE